MLSQIIQSLMPKENISVELLFGADCVDQPKIGLLTTNYIKKTIENIFANLLYYPSITLQNNHYNIHTVFSTGSSMVFHVDKDKENIEDMDFILSFHMLIGSNKQLGKLSLKNKTTDNPFVFKYVSNKDKTLRKKDFRNKLDNFITTLLEIKKEDVVLNLYSIIPLNKAILINPYIMYSLSRINIINIDDLNILKDHLNTMINQFKEHKIIDDMKNNPLLLNCNIDKDIRWSLSYGKEYEYSENNFLIHENTELFIFKELVKCGLINDWVLEQDVTAENLNDVIDVLKTIGY